MNPTSADPTAPPPPQPQPQPPRSSFSCDRHPEEQFTGFCPACLCERLTTLDQSSANTPSSSRRPSSAAAAAIKSLFSSSSTATSKPSNLPPPAPPPKPSRPVSFFPELRRSKSFSASKNEGLGLFVEPQRKSCDVRARNTLSSLFTLNNVNKSDASCNRPSIVVSASSSSHQNPQNSKRIESSVVNKPVLVETGNVGNSRDTANVEAVHGVSDYSGDGNRYEIRSVRDSNMEDLGNSEKVETNCGETVEEEEEVVTAANLKPMKDHIDGDSREKKSTVGGFWAAASVFSKKWHKWRHKQKMKKEDSSGGLATLPVEKPISRQYRDTQSEIADYGFERRSCDTDPRFSLDAVRISFDDPRYSFEEPRASWDGHLIGRSFPRMAPMVSVMEDAPAVHISRSDMQISVEDPTKEIDGVPGGSAQTREYYSDSSSRRRKSLDRSSSIRKTAAAVVAEIDELKTSTNAKVSPATAADSFHGSKVILGERNLGDSNSHSLRDDCSETFELGSGSRGSGNSVVGNGEKKESKKSRKWGWRIWGFIQRRNGGNKDNEDEKYSRVNGVERSLSESWKDSRSGDVRGTFNRNMFRSNSSVSWRNANSFGSAFGASMGKSGVEMNGHGKKRKDEFVLEKNRSARYSPNHVDNGLLRLYLTPLRNSRKGGLGKIKANNSISRSVLRLY